MNRTRKTGAFIAVAILSGVIRSVISKWRDANRNKRILFIFVIASALCICVALFFRAFG